MFLHADRWDDDVIFKNQTRGEPERKKRFINDTVRSDFHRRFMEKFLRNLASIIALLKPPLVDTSSRADLPFLRSKNHEKSITFL